MSEFSCRNCGAEEKKYRRGLCRPCYNRERYEAMPPSKCHPDRREHAAGLCRSCYRSGLRAKKAECHPERLHVAKGLCRECYNALPENKERSIQARRLRKYKLTKIEYDKIADKQGWSCAICEAHPTAVDHCHETGVVRGLLCHLCNVGLGHFRDSPAFLRGAASYLEGVAT